MLRLEGDHDICSGPRYGRTMIVLTRPRILAPVAAALVVAIYVASPYLMLWRLQRAAGRDDTATLEKLIDFPAVRAAMKAEAAGTLRDKIGSVIPSKLVSGFLGGTLGPEVTNRLVDERVTPAAAARLIKDGKIARASFVGLTRFNFEAQGVKASAKFSGFDWRVDWIGLP